MNNNSSLLAGHLIIILLMMMAGSAFAAQQQPFEHISGPFTHDNLSVYFIHGKSEAGPVPLSLAEAMEQGKVRVNETGRVRKLSIENLSEKEVFIQAGDIVKGGKQDRVLTISMILKPKSGIVPIGSFCVEQGRWAARGKESVARFASSTMAAPSRKMKLAIMKSNAPSQTGSLHRRERPAARRRIRRNQAERRERLTERVARIRRLRERNQIASTGRPESSGQGKIWDEVRKMQNKLSKRLKKRVNAAKSASSLQLALEDNKLQETKTAYLDTLEAKAKSNADIIGYAIAINGKFNSADIYSSNGLFIKMWPKQLRAGVAEAISEKNTKNVFQIPAVSSITKILQTRSDKVTRNSQELLGVELEQAETVLHYFTQTRRKSSKSSKNYKRAFHLNYLASEAKN